MRLIDADALILHLVDYRTQEIPIDDRDEIAVCDTISECIEAVEEAPTIEAIPVEWIIKKACTEELYRPAVALLECLVRDWGKENDR